MFQGLRELLKFKKAHTAIFYDFIIEHGLKRAEESTGGAEEGTAGKFLKCHMI